MTWSRSSCHSGQNKYNEKMSNVFGVKKPSRQINWLRKKAKAKKTRSKILVAKKMVKKNGVEKIGGKKFGSKKIVGTFAKRFISILHFGFMCID